MLIKQLIDEDFVNYKKPSMFIAFPSCNWKCEKECGERVCQNGTLATSQSINISCENIAERYSQNHITSAIVMGGLEPLDSFDELYKLVKILRLNTKDDIVIYTGYYKKEVLKYINKLKDFSNIIIKFGRYKPNQEKHFDNILGVYLASNNQYAERIS